MTSHKAPSKVGHLVSPKDQSADFVELFFDLVFVFAITQVTHITAHHLDAIGVLQSLLVFWLIWWGWTQFTWSLNAADTRHPKIRLATLAATAVAFVMAVSTELAFTDDVMWFAVPYLVIRIVGFGLYYRVTPQEAGARRAVALMFALTCMGLIAVLVGALMSPTARLILWTASIVLEGITVWFGGRQQALTIRAPHFAERHALIVIIALGESLIVAASAVAGAPRSVALIQAGALAVAITCGLWWSYFAWIIERMEHRLTHAPQENKIKMARDVFSLAHFPLICGIIGVAVAFERILSHPEASLTVPYAAALGGGVLLIVGATGVAIWRASRTFLAPRLLILLVTVGATFLVVGQSPVYALGLLAVGLFVVNAVEWKYCRVL